MTPRTLTLLIALLGPVAARAADPVPGPLRVYVVADGRFPSKAAPGTSEVTAPRDPRDRTDRHHDFVIEQGLNPMLIVVTRADPAADGVAAQVAKSAAALYDERALGNTSLGVFVTFAVLDNEFANDTTRIPDGGFVRDDQAKQVKDLATALALPRVPLSLAARQSETLKQWGMADGDDTLVVLANQLQFVKRWTFAPGQFDESALKEIVAETRKVAARQ